MAKVRFTLAILLTAFASPGQSAGGEERDEFCSMLGRVAEHIMRQRQTGKSLDDTLKMMNRPGNRISELARSLTLMAYDTPRYNSDEFAARAISDFRDKAHLECLKSVD